MNAIVKSILETHRINNQRVFQRIQTIIHSIETSFSKIPYAENAIVFLEKGYADAVEILFVAMLAAEDWRGGKNVGIPLDNSENIRHLRFLLGEVKPTAVQFDISFDEIFKKAINTFNSDLLNGLKVDEEMVKYVKLCACEERQNMAGHEEENIFKQAAWFGDLSCKTRDSLLPSCRRIDEEGRGE